MNQRRLDVVQAEMPRLHINILGIKELKYIGISQFPSKEPSADPSDPTEDNKIIEKK